MTASISARTGWLAALLAGAALVSAVYVMAARQGAAEVLVRAQRQLQLMAPELESALEKFETLPYVVGFQDDVAQALAHPDDQAGRARVNRIFQAIQLQSRVNAIYLMDREGNTLAASNWDSPRTFVGRNFAFRPYFHEALAGHAGRFYGVGNTTSEPGYFIAQPVRAGAAITGVIAVKISLDEFERNWTGSDDAIALADKVGVVFLSNRPEWKYRSLAPLGAPTQRALAATLQYGRQPVQAIGGALPQHASHRIGRLDWELKLFPARQRVARNAALWALGAALLLASCAMGGWALEQRRRRLEERGAAARELDLRIAERTAQLRQANDDLAARYATLEKTGQVLRSTQDELVQAGKLAMLGQMAAGVTHELNQPLAAIRAFADNARVFLERGQSAQARDNLGHIGDASARMGAIISQLKGFARRSDTLGTVDLLRSMQASAFLLQSEFRRIGAELTIAEAPQLLVAGDAVRVEQVFINLLRNALDAVETSASRVIAVGMAQHDGWARVTIADSGAGMPGEVAQHLFEPFFTTKPSGKGLGLGLAISSSIIQAMNGQLTGRNGDQGGAIFEVRIPLQEKE